MIIRLLIILFVVAIIILGIGAYLSPDDLAGCDAPQGQSGMCRPAGAIVVVSGGDTVARTSEAIALYQAGWAPYIVFSGAAADKDGPSNAQAMKEQALAAGVPEEATVVEGESETTKQNAEQVRGLLEPMGVKDVIVVTSGYHMRRTGLEFESQLGDTTVRRHPVSDDKHWSDVWWMTPWGWWLAMGELVKIGIFHIGGTR